MKKRSKQPKKASRIKNLVRGVASILSAPNGRRKFSNAWRSEQLALQQVYDAINLAKKELSPSEINTTLNWIFQYGSQMGLIWNQLGTKQKLLGVLSSAIETKGLASEIKLIKERLVNKGKQIENICAEIKQYEKAFIKQDWSSGLEIINSFIGKHGYSYWAIEAKLSMLQAAEGLEAMKSEAVAVSTGSVGINKFLVHYLGVRNEPALNSYRFKENLRRKLESSSLSDGLKAYCSYRLYGDLGYEEKKIAQILAAEQMTTGIDLFITAAKISLWLLFNKNKFSRSIQEAVGELIKAVGYLMEQIDIPLLDTLVIKQDSNESLSKMVNQKTLDLVSDKNARVARDAIVQLLSGDIESSLSMDKPVMGAIIRGLTSKISTFSDGVAAEDLLKLQLNFGLTTTMFTLGEIVDVDQFPEMLLDVSLRDKYLIEVPIPVRDAFVYELRRILDTQFKDFKDHEDYEALRMISSSINLYQAGSAEKSVIILLEASNKSKSPIIKDAALTLAASFQCISGDEGGAVSTIAKAGLQNEKLINLLPVEKIFQGARWGTISDYGPSIDLAICLEFYLRTFDDSKVRSYKRFSIISLLKECECITLVELLDALVADGVDNSKLEYFFYNVCDVYTMELLPEMHNSKIVHEHRRDLLRKLSDISQYKKLTYLSEAREIEDLLSVNDGLEILDDSRVYVDETRLRNIINQELASDFQRYLNLVSAGIGVSESFSEVLRSINKPTVKDFQIPKSDADDLLAEIIFQIREKFLFDPAYGLDVHLSRRIRHGTISNQIRGPLESESMIGQREKVGASYDPPDAIVKLCANVDKNIRSHAYSAFSRFSESIDQHISLLRDEYFHVQRPEKPNGQFVFSINALFLNLARSVAQTCSNIDEFSKNCIGLFWFVLSHRVVTNRARVENESKKEIKSIFGRLLRDLWSAGIEDLDFMAKVQKTSEEIMKRISLISSWIRVPSVVVENKNYPMTTIVDIALAASMGQRPGFKPILNRMVPENIALDTYGLSVVSDALYIALENVYLHSGKKVDNKIDIQISFDENQSLLIFNIASEMSPDSRTIEKEEHLQNIREKISRRTFGEGVRSEGRSGLMKLAALVLQSNKTSIEFGFLGEAQFHLKFMLDYISVIKNAD